MCNNYTNNIYYPGHVVTATGARTSAVLFRKRGNIPKGSVPPQGSKFNNRRLTSLDLKGKVARLGDGWQVSGKSTDSVTACHPNDLTADQPYQPTRAPVYHQ